MDDNYAQVNANPNLGSAISGYYIPRFAKGFLDDIEVSALVLVLDYKKIALVSVDNLGIDGNIRDSYCELIEKETGIVKKNKAQAELSQHMESDPLPLRKAKITHKPQK